MRQVLSEKKRGLFQSEHFKKMGDFPQSSTIHLPNFNSGRGFYKGREGKQSKFIRVMGSATSPDKGGMGEGVG